MSETDKPRAAIFYLTQNTPVRRTYLKTSLYFLFRHFNAVFQYPVILFHEGDFTLKDQEDVLMGIRESCRHWVSFQTMDPEDFKVPSHLDADKVRRVVALKPVPYWRNDKYRMMCRWWLLGFQKYAVNYDYVMRLDDDSFIEEPLTQDMFRILKNKQSVYASNLIHTDCALCCYGMREFFEPKFKAAGRSELMSELFMPTKIPMKAIQCHTFRSVLTLNGVSHIPEELAAWSPIIYYNNFFVMDMNFWRRSDVQELCREIDQNGSIFYYRWGDAPLHTLIVSLLAGPSRIERFRFRYSKRMQREAFHGDDGNFHCYMPREYSQSSCISDRAEKAASAS
jgi:Glycolipid 2-alpha-mannosyltransferase